MSSKQRSAPTPFGEVDYETVTCASCDNEVAKKEAERFAIGGYEHSRYGSVKFDKSDARLGWACPYCADEEPAGFPSRRHIVDRLLDKDPFEVALAVSFAIVCLAGMIAVALEAGAA